MSDLVIPIIDAVTGEYRFLSKFADAPTPYRGRVYPTREHVESGVSLTNSTAITIPAKLASGRV